MEFKFVSSTALLALGLAACARAEQPNDVSSLAGVYSSAHSVTVNGARLQTNGYIEIDRAGHITAFEQGGEGETSAGSGCYVLANGTATNAGLQGRILTRGVSPVGEAAFQTRAGDDDTFGILLEPGANGQLRWFFHAGRPNSTVTVNGYRNVVNAANHASYSISGPALATPTPDELRGMLCRADSASSQTDATRNASAKEIEGYWQLLLPSNPWPAACQWFSYGSDGEMKSIDKLRGPCASNSKAQLQEIFSAIPAVISWQYDLSPVYNKGVLIIKRSDVKGYAEIWEPQIVVKPFTNGGVAFEAGDLLLYLTDLQSHKIVWIRHLRKAS